MRTLIRTEKRLKYVMVILSVLALIPSTALYANAGETLDTCVSLCKFAGGITTAFMIHEGGHAAVAALTGTKLDWRIGDSNQPMKFNEHADSDAIGLAINSAGLVTQAIAGEIILQSEDIDMNSAFWRGMMAWNILNPISYALDYWFIHRTNKIYNASYEGDISGIEYYSNKETANAFAFSISAIALVHGYRFLKTQSWAPDWLKSTSHNLTVQPLSSGGALLACRFDF